MAEYIEREAVLKTSPFTRYGGNPNAYNDGYLDCAEDAREAVKAIPAADVVEVVRCKDCKYFIPDKCLDHTKYPNDLEADGLCGNIDKYTDEDRFCSSGAKMDGKGEGE